MPSFGRWWTAHTTLLGVEVSVLQVVDPRDPSRLVTVATRGFDDVPPAAIGQTSVNVGLNGEALLRGEPVAIDDYQRFPNAQPQARASGLKVAIAAPVRSRGCSACCSYARRLSRARLTAV
jgi:hypothetical protein